MPRSRSIALEGRLMGCLYNTLFNAFVEVLHNIHKTEKQIGIIILINPKHSETLDIGITLEKNLVYILLGRIVLEWMTMYCRMTLYWKMDVCVLNG